MNLLEDKVYNAKPTISDQTREIKLTFFEF